MTEKELKKLSRLELLELLLEASTENHELNEQVKKLKAEIDTAQHIQQLSDTVTQAESLLEKVRYLAMSSPAPDAEMANAEAPAPSLLDTEIYRCLLRFFAKNEELMAMLPLELQIAVQERIPDIPQ